MTGDRSDDHARPSAYAATPMGRPLEPFSEVVVVEPEVYEDARGLFYEAWNQRSFEGLLGYEVRFVQDNQSRSARGVLRGIHYQVEPHPQGKLVRVLAGSVFDVVVDLRRSSPTFKEWASITLSGENRLQVWVPPGFGHGFLALADDTQVLYKTSDYYCPACERAVAWNDPELGIDWPLESAPILSAKDAGVPFIPDAELF